MQQESRPFRIETVPPAQMPEVLRVAAELYAREQTQLAQADERRQLVEAAAEVGLPPEYLERAAALVAEEQARHDAAPGVQRGRRERRSVSLAVGLAVGLAIAAFGIRAGREREAAPPPPAIPSTVAPAPAVTAPLIGPCTEVDLSRHVTHRLDEPMLSPGNHLGTLLAGLREEGVSRRILHRVPFRLDGVVMVGPGETSSGEQEGLHVPPQVEGIPIDRKAKRLHFLHATHWRARDGTQIGAYIVHYADGTRLEIPIRYGEDMRDWWERSDRETRVTRARVAWSGSNEASSRLRSKIRLWVSSWTNPYPQKPIVTLDMVTGEQPAGPQAPAPFLVGLTVEQESNASAQETPPPPAARE